MGVDEPHLTVTGVSGEPRLQTRRWPAVTRRTRPAPRLHAPRPHPADAPEAPLQVAVCRPDAHGRLRVTRLGLPADLVDAGGAAGGRLWPQRWAAGVVVAGRCPGDVLAPPVTLTGPDRLTLPPGLRAHLGSANQALLAVWNGEQLWLMTPAYLTAHLP